MWLGGPLGPSRVDAVESEDGVEVNQSATLELGDLRVGQPNSAAVGLCDLVELAAQGDDRAAPELGGVGVPDDSGVVVVAVRAQRPAQAGVVLLVPLAAGDPLPVRAVAGLAPGSAPSDRPRGGDDAGVHRAE